MARVFLTLFFAILLGACSARGWYSGLQNAEQQRQAATPGAPQRTTPDVPYERYEAERKGEPTGETQ